VISRIAESLSDGIEDVLSCIWGRAPVCEGIGDRHCGMDETYVQSRKEQRSTIENKLRIFYLGDKEGR
jgi:hypothetical protein